MNPHPKMIVFDFDGVLADFREEFFDLHRRFFDAELTPEKEREIFYGNVAALFQELEEKHGKELLEQWEKEKMRFVKKKRLSPEARRVLQFLASRWALAINSSNSHAFINDFLARSRARNMFSDILAREHHFSKKEKFLHLMQKYALHSQEILFFTDTVGDIREAQEVDVASCAVDFGYHSRRDLEKENPLAVFSSWQEIALFFAQ